MLLGGGRRNRIHANRFVDCDYDIHMDNRGMSSSHASWATICSANCSGPTCFQSKLEAVHYQQPPWSERFPELVNVFENHPCVPVNNDISDNTYCHTNSLNVSAELGFINVNQTMVHSWLSSMSNNRWNCEM